MYEFTELFLYKFVFIAELLIAMHMYSFRMKKRKRFALRVALGVVVCMALGYAYPVMSFSPWYASLMFLVLFFICAASLFFIYDIPVKQVFFLSVASYTTQHFSHELYSLIATTTRLALEPTLGMYGDEIFTFDFGSARFWFSGLVYIEVYLVCYWVLYKIFGRKINREDMRISNFSIAVIAALILLVDIVMNAVAVYISDGYNSTYAVLANIYNLICCMLILYIQVRLCVEKKLEKELETLSLLLHQSEEQYRQSNENIMLLNLKCHDLKHQIREYTQKRTMDEEYIKDLENIVNIYDSPVKTGNEALDLVHIGAVVGHRDGNVLDTQVGGNAKVAIVAGNRAQELDLLAVVRCLVSLPRIATTRAATPEHTGDIVLDQKARRTQYERLLGRAAQELPR